jgi:hypothetical protein
MSIYDDALGPDDLFDLDFSVYDDHQLHSKKKWRAKCVELQLELIARKEEIAELKQILRSTRNIV